MDFFALNPDEREVHIRRIMIESVTEFNHSRCAESYISLYEKMLERPFIVSPFLSKS
jgi:starch synthase/alpha-amylase